MIEADAADQELLVYLPHHWTCAAGLTLSHGDRHSQTRLGARTHLNLSHTQTHTHDTLPDRGMVNHPLKTTIEITVLNGL